MSVNVPSKIRRAHAEPDRSSDPRQLTAVVLGSLAIGIAAATTLTLVVLPRAPEGVSTGAALVGFGLGWATLHVLSRRTARPQLWAAVPAATMTLTGAVLMVTAPTDRTLTTLAWAWPPMALTLVGWTYARAQRGLTGSGQWAVASVLLALAAASVGAGVAQLTTRPFADAHPAPGEVHNVDDHDLHIDCRGARHPTVVLINGLGEFSASWARVLDGVAPTTRVCAYDRAGQGWSDDIEHPQGGVAAAQDLHRDELAVLPTVFRQAQALATLGSRPLVVLTSAARARDTDGWTEAQERMGALSSNAVTREAAASHAGMVEDPGGAAASVRAIASVVQAVRAGTASGGTCCSPSVPVGALGSLRPRDQADHHGGVVRPGPPSPCLHRHCAPGSPGRVCRCQRPAWH